MMRKQWRHSARHVYVYADFYYFYYLIGNIQIGHALEKRTSREPNLWSNKRNEYSIFPVSDNLSTAEYEDAEKVF